MSLDSASNLPGGDTAPGRGGSGGGETDGGPDGGKEKNIMGGGGGPGVMSGSRSGTHTLHTQQSQPEPGPGGASSGSSSHSITASGSYLSAHLTTPGSLVGSFVTGESRVDKFRKLIASPLNRRKSSSAPPVPLSNKVFGAPLEVLAHQHNPIPVFPSSTTVDKEPNIPYVVTRLCRYIIDSNGIIQEGVFRVSGNAKLIERLRSSFDTFGDAPLEQEADTAAASALLKLFLRELPEPIIPKKMYPPFLAAMKEQNHSRRPDLLRNLHGLVHGLPLENFSLLRYLSFFLAQVASHESVNRMGAPSLGIVFGPNLFRLTSDDHQQSLREQGVINQIVSTFIQETEKVFGAPMTASRAQPSGEGEAATAAFGRQSTLSPSTSASLAHTRKSVPNILPPSHVSMGALNIQTPPNPIRSLSTDTTEREFTSLTLSGPSEEAGSGSAAFSRSHSEVQASGREDSYQGTPPSKDIPILTLDTTAIESDERAEQEPLYRGSGDAFKEEDEDEERETDDIALLASPGGKSVSDDQLSWDGDGVSPNSSYSGNDSSTGMRRSGLPAALRGDGPGGEGERTRSTSSNVPLLGDMACEYGTGYSSPSPAPDEQQPRSGNLEGDGGAPDGGGAPEGSSPAGTTPRENCDLQDSSNVDSHDKNDDLVFDNDSQDDEDFNDERRKAERTQPTVIRRTTPPIVFRARSASSGSAHKSAHHHHHRHNHHRHQMAKKKGYGVPIQPRYMEIGGSGGGPGTTTVMVPESPADSDSNPLSVSSPSSGKEVEYTMESIELARGNISEAASVPISITLNRFTTTRLSHPMLEVSPGENVTHILASNRKARTVSEPSDSHRMTRIEFHSSYSSPEDEKLDEVRQIPPLDMKILYKNPLGRESLVSSSDSHRGSWPLVRGGMPTMSEDLADVPQFSESPIGSSSISSCPEPSATAVDRTGPLSHNYSHNNSLEVLRKCNSYEAPLSPSAFRGYLNRHSAKDLADEGIPPSPPQGHFPAARSSTAADGSPSQRMERSGSWSQSLYVRQLNKQLSLVKRRLKDFERDFEHRHGYKPNQEQKMTSPEVKKVMIELNGLKKQLKEIRDDAQMVEVKGLQQTSFADERLAAIDRDLLGSVDIPHLERHSNGNEMNSHDVYGIRGDGLRDGTPAVLRGDKSSLHFHRSRYLDGDGKPLLPVGDMMLEIDRILAEKRTSCQRPDSLELMTREEIGEEKLTIQKALLRYEGIYGRPESKEERDIMRPLYDRYRAVKRLVNKRPTPSLDSPTGKDENLQPILEHEAMSFMSPSQEAAAAAAALLMETSSPLPREAAHSPMKRGPPPQTPKRRDEEDESGIGGGGGATSSSVPVPPVPTGGGGRGELQKSGNNSNANLHELPIPELLRLLEETRSEKKHLRRVLKNFEENFQRKMGRRVEREDRVHMEVVYSNYKHMKGKVRLLEALVAKHEQYNGP